MKVVQFFFICILVMNITGSQASSYKASKKTGEEVGTSLNINEILQQQGSVVTESLPSDEQELKQLQSVNDRNIKQKSEAVLYESNSDTSQTILSVQKNSHYKAEDPFADYISKSFSQQLSDLGFLSKRYEPCDKDNHVKKCPVYCIGKYCEKVVYEDNKDFAKVATWLNLMKSMSDDIDHKINQVFNGTRERCKIKIFGFSNCCRNKGWGKKLGLTSCSEHEKLLIEKNKKKLCRYMGTYKRGSFISRKKYRSYCCFKSRLSLILHQQAREQLRLGWGGAKHPNCRGLTLEELRKIDFSKIDLSEVFPDFENIINTKKATDIKINATQRINDYYKLKMQKKQENKK